jgi:hypothetical protein
MNCQIEFANDDIGMPCAKIAVARYADCGTAICSDCCVECCGDSFCGQCYDYHVTHSCVRKPVQYERHTYPLPAIFGGDKEDRQRRRV